MNGRRHNGRSDANGTHPLLMIFTKCFEFKVLNVSHSFCHLAATESIPRSWNLEPTIRDIQRKKKESP